jgi:hypothetical protein
MKQESIDVKKYPFQAMSRLNKQNMTINRHFPAAHKDFSAKPILSLQRSAKRSRGIQMLRGFCGIKQDDKRWRQGNAEVPQKRCRYESGIVHRITA